MLSKRHTDILKILDARGTMSVTALAETLAVSAETVRRDLKPLMADGAVLRMHGAVGLPTPSGEAPFRRRMRENSAAKQAIARLVAGLVRDGDTLMMDTGTTTSFVARALTGHRKLTVITNSTDVARTLSSGGGNRVFLTGGEVLGDSGALLGSAAVAFVRGFHAGLALLSAGAVDASGVMDFDPEEAAFARAMLAQAERRLVATDATKFARRGLVTVAGFDSFHDLVTDGPPPPAIAQAMAVAGTRLHVAPHSARDAGTPD